MKRYSIFILTFVLTAAFLVGCGCTGPTMEESEAPTVLPTNEEVIPTTRETAQPTTQATAAPTAETAVPSETVDRGNGPLEDTATEAAESTAANGNGSAERSMSRG